CARRYYGSSASPYYAMDYW
nr:immunoglobulin heavy chain junction region [Mus musculus]MBK4186551.1 immunoglobulin heavy chain junction region [Mus musculus]